MPSPSSRFLLASQVYVCAWCVIAVAAGAGAVDDYSGGPTSTRVFAWIGTIMGSLLFTGIALECLNYSGQVACVSDLLNWLLMKNYGERGTHIAINVLSICSVGIAAVNMHTETWDWQFGLSCSLMIMVLFYNLFCTPCVLVSYAAYYKMNATCRNALDLQYSATSYIWKTSQVEELMNEGVTAAV